MSIVTAPPRTPATPSRPPGRPAGRVRRAWDRHWYAWAMALPVVIVLAVLIFYPLVRGIYLSFTNLTEANQQSEICTRSITGEEDCQPNPNSWRFVGLDNYAKVLTGEVGEFWQWLGITLIWTVACVVFHYAIGLGLAVLLNRPMRGRGVYRTAALAGAEGEPVAPTAPADTLGGREGQPVATADPVPPGGAPSAADAASVETAVSDTLPLPVAPEGVER